MFWNLIMLKFRVCLEISFFFMFAECMSLEHIFAVHYIYRCNRTQLIFALSVLSYVVEISLFFCRLIGNFCTIHCWRQTQTEYTRPFKNNINIETCKTTGFPTDKLYLPLNVCFIYPSILACVPYDTRFVVLNTVFRLLSCLVSDFFNSQQPCSIHFYYYLCIFLLPVRCDTHC